jgi:superfamily II DNA or RNA helicase
MENARTKVVRATPDEHDWLRHYLTFEEIIFLGRGRNIRTKKTSRCLLDRRNNTFPTGLIPYIVRQADLEKQEEQDAKFTEEMNIVYSEDMSLDGDSHVEFEVVVDDQREPPCEWDWDADLEWLYDYQYRPVWMIGHKIPRGILKLATGAGKTEIAIGLMKALPCHWLFVVNSKDLMWQAAKRYEKRTGLEGGIIGDGIWRPDPEGRATFATFQSLHVAMYGREATKKRKEIPPKPEARPFIASVRGVVVDEVHTVAAKTFWEVVMQMRSAYYRIGISGTPLDRGDKKSIFSVAAVGPIIYTVEAQELIDRGVLAQPKIRAVIHKEDADVNDWQQAYRQIVVESTSRNSLVVRLVEAAEKPAFVFVNQVKHGHFLKKHLRQSGMNCDFVWGDDKTPQRETAIRQLRQGDLDVLVCSVVFQTGIDVPELRSVVNAAGMKSTIAALQRIGRGMRTDQGRKSTFDVWDIKDESDKFMSRHANSRLRAYRKEGHDVAVITTSELRRLVG